MIFTKEHAETILQEIAPKKSQYGWFYIEITAARYTEILGIEPDYDVWSYNHIDDVPKGLIVGFGDGKVKIDLDVIVNFLRKF